MRTSMILSVAVAALIAAGCGSDSKPSSDKSVCTVNGQPVSQALFDQVIDQTTRSFKSSNQTVPKKGTPERDTFNQQVVNTLIQQELLSQVADDLGVRVTKKQVQERIDALVESTFKGDKAKYQKQLKQQGLTQESVKRNIRQQLLNEKVFTLLGADIKPTDAQLRKAYNEQKERYDVADSRDIAHVLVASPKLAATLRTQIAAKPGSIAALAKKYSADPASAAQGGKLTVNRGQTTEAFDIAAFALKTGEVSKVVHTEYGYHVIVALSDVRDGKNQTFAQVRDTVEAVYRQDRQNAQLQKLLSAKQDKAKVKCSGGYKWKPSQPAQPKVQAAPKS